MFPAIRPWPMTLPSCHRCHHHRHCAVKLPQLLPLPRCCFCQAAAAAATTAPSRRRSTAKAADHHHASATAAALPPPPLCRRQAAAAPTPTVPLLHCYHRRHCYRCRTAAAATKLLPMHCCQAAAPKLPPPPRHRQAAAATALPPSCHRPSSLSFLYQEQLTVGICADVMDVGEGIAGETAIKLMRKEIGICSRYRVQTRKMCIYGQN
jgi:hypothetical protein